MQRDEADKTIRAQSQQARGTTTDKGHDYYIMKGQHTSYFNYTVSGRHPGVITT